MVALDSFWKFCSTIPWFAWIAIAGIAAGAVRQVVSMSHKHQERMEMIRQGLDPRNPPRQL
ncbi:MAG: hypothetical protein HZA51_08850 [Planctomycetes bacterium]|nr:hypothetical protein [Planctomycetota bacterium]